MRTWRTSEIADAALWMSIILAPVAGGSSSVLMLPVLAVIVSVGYVACIVDHRRTGSRVYLFMLPIGLVALAAFTILQIIPLPGLLLELISPRAHEIRRFIANGEWAPISYEPASTARDAAKLILYAMIALLAADRARLKKSFDIVAIPVVIAGISSLVVAFVQRLLDADRMLGVLPAMKPASKLLTTFVNPNHGAAFLVLASITAVGLALAETERPRRRWMYMGAAAITAVGSALCFSRGGFGALVLAFVGFAFAMFWRHDATGELRSRAAAIAGVVILFPLAAVLIEYDELIHSFEMTDKDPLGIQTKLAAVKDSIGLVIDHPLFGIGRGAYVSVYPAYKTAAFQLTFTHPENIVAQLISDWGVLAGGAALITFVTCTFRRIRLAATPVVLASTIAILVIAAQNLVDFNLELPGMAIPVAALLGAATPRALVFARIWPKRYGALRALISVPVSLLLVGTVLAFAGDLESDQAELDLAVRERRWDRTTTTPAIDRESESLSMQELTEIAARHPANPVLAAQLSYLAETATPPDYTEAIHWANRTLLLAPTYADGHLGVGRMLVRGGHRAQGFMHARRGWELASEERLPAFIRHVIGLARDAHEIREAIPRRDPALDVIDEKQLAVCVRELHAMSRDEWAVSLLDSLDPATVPGDTAIGLAHAALQIGKLKLAQRVIERRVAEAPGDTVAIRLLLDVLWKQKNTARLAEVLNVVLQQPDIDPIPFLRVRVEASLREGHLEVARSTLEILRRKMSPTLANQVDLARMEASIESHDSQPGRAVRALDRAIQLAPRDVPLRYARAQALAKTGRVTEARSDLELILRLDPKHRAAQALLVRVQSGQRAAASTVDLEPEQELP